ncbi:MAG TPA: GNAT family N-acetyltransferase [Acidimicrobiales bacterium]|nr:GNAT family N-acetyltransferase [Acidimicrobiales bacterium]
MRPPIEWPDEVDAGEGVVLRAPDPIDAEGLTDAITESLDELRPWMTWAAEAPAVDQQAVRLAVVAEAFAAGADAHYTIFVDGEVGGSIGIHDRLGDPAVREIGYWRRTSFAGRGVVTRAVEAVVEVLAARRFERAVIRCDAGNHRSAAVARRTGFTHVRTEDAPERDAPATTHRTMVWERRLG